MSPIDLQTISDIRLELAVHSSMVLSLISDVGGRGDFGRRDATGDIMEQAATLKKPRPVGMVLFFAILLIPLIFSWFLLGKGYSAFARALGFGWLGLWFWGSLAGWGGDDPVAKQSDAVVTTSPKQPDPAAEPLFKAKTASPKTEHMRRVEELIVKLSKPQPLSLPGTDPKSEINEAVATMSEWAQLYNDGRPFSYNDKERARRAELWRLIQRAQAKVFPRARALQGQLWRQAAWEHEVDVITNGDRLLLRGPFFILRKNMKTFVKTFEPTIVFLRYKRVSFQAYHGDDTSYFDYPTLPDTQIATLNIQNWQAIKP